MIYVGIDVTKDKHDCFITNSDGEVLFDVFTISNNRDGFDELYQKISCAIECPEKSKVGPEATEHYSYNLLGFLLDKGLTTFVSSPLPVCEGTGAGKAQKFCFTTGYHPIPGIGKTSAYTSHGVILCITFRISSVGSVASAHLTRLTNLLEAASRGRYGKDTAIRFREAAKSSIGSHMPAKLLELKHTIQLIQILSAEFDEIEKEIKIILDEINSPILSIPEINYRMGSMILAEIGDFDRFDSPDKIFAYAGLSPSTYQSGQLDSSYSHMEKRGSKYLRYALYNATKYVCHWDKNFSAYLAKKRAEGKHYNVAISHAAKKLVRLIYQLKKSGRQYRKTA